MNAVQNTEAALPVAGLAPGASAPKARETEDRFLKLLVAQMKNQDPLNPLDNAQVTAQMAQLSTVSGIEKLNDTMQSLAAGFNASQWLQAAAMIGHGVLAPGAALTLENGRAVFGAELAESAERVLVTIRDGSGAALTTLDLGPQPAGTLVLEWDGATDSGATAAAGAYSFSADAFIGGKKTPAAALSFARVESVAQGSQGVSLTLGGGASAALSDIRQIF